MSSKYKIRQHKPISLELIFSLIALARFSVDLQRGDNLKSPLKSPIVNQMRR